MPPSLRAVVGLPGLDLRLRGGEQALDRPVRWVAVSELVDPTPYLEGGELLLTTGMRLRRFDAYVARLVDAGVAALGLAVGLTHDRVPDDLAQAAERHGLPLLEVPEPTPFIAVSRAVSDLLAAEEYEAVTRAVETQRDLTRAASSPDGGRAVVGRLARALGADVLLLDPNGGLLVAEPPGAAAQLRVLAAEVAALRPRGPRAAAALSEAGRTAVIQPLAAADRVRGYLAVARAEPLGAVDRTLVSVAVALVALTLEADESGVAARRDLRSALLALLDDGVAADRLPMAAAGWSWLAQARVRVLVGAGDPASYDEVLDAVDQPPAAATRRGGARFGDRLVLLVSDDEPAVAAALALGPGLSWGVSDPVGAHQVADGLRQAVRALAAVGPRGVRRFADLASGGVVGLLDPQAARGFADRLLGPLEARERGDLVASVRAWLAHHGQWDAAASSLGVHRHTLRYRMRRVEELLGRSLDDPDLRTDLWVALAVRDWDEAE